MKATHALSFVLLGACTSAAPATGPDASSPDGALADAALTDAGADSPVSSERRNVLLVIFDDVGAEEIRSYARELAAIKVTNPSSTGIKDANKNAIPDGLEDLNGDGQPDGAIETPMIDSLASAGVRFTQAWSNPVCSPTRAGVYTGRYVTHHGVGSPLGDPQAIWALPHDVPTLPELLKKEGSSYKTGLFGKWHLGALNGSLPTDRGWSYFSGSLDGVVDDYYKWSKVVVDEEGKRTNTTSTTYATTSAVNDALEWIGKQSNPWWATVALNAAHTPYSEPPSTCLSGKLTGSDDTSLFHKMIECADREVARLLEGLGSAKLSNTTIIFMGDNGTESPVTQVYSGPRSKSSAYQGGVHVPLIIADGATLTRAPGANNTGSVTNPGRTIKSPVHSVDLFATIASIVGSSAASTDAVGMIDYLSSNADTPARKTTYTDAWRYQADDVAKLKASIKDPSQLTLAQVKQLTPTLVRGAIRDTQYKVIYDSDGYKLFDLKADPFEQTNLWCSGAAKAKGEELAAAIKAIDSVYPAAKCP